MRLALALLVGALLTLPGIPAAAAVQGRVAVVGITGLEWSDLDQNRTPNLWNLVGQGGSASLSTRAVPPPDRGITCPTAGWLTVSAGQRAGTAGRGCAPIPAPQPQGEGATIPGWQQLVTYQASTGYNAVLGTLGQAVTDAGGKIAAIGPGAAIAAATKSGNLTKYADSLEAAGDLTPNNLIVLDAPSLADAWTRQPHDEYGIPQPLPPTTRQAAAAEADRRVGALLNALPSGTTVLVAGISDVTPNAHLHVAIAGGPPYRHGLLTATSTRQDGLVTITDLTATTLHLLGVPEPGAIVGRTWENGGPAPATVAETVTQLSDSDLASQVLRDVRGPFFAVFVTVQLLFYAAAALALRHRRRTTPPPQPTTSTTATAEPPTASDSAPPPAASAGRSASRPLAATDSLRTSTTLNV
ncbi:MAG: hypothetical protein HOY71_33455, partial [Nonomuraea sp.]|nr:hypothetical protein [Nonomuraea sp.]